MNIKKIISVMMLLILTVLSSSCSSGSGSDMYGKGIKAFESGDYKTAESYFESAMSKGYEKKNIKELFDIVSNYNSAKKCIENENYEDAEKFAGEIPEAYKNYGIKEDVLKLQNIIEDYKQANKDFDRIMGLYDSGLYDAAENILAEIDVKYLTGSDRAKLTETEKKIGKAKKSLYENETKETMKKESAIPEQEISELMREYAWGLTDAINNNDFGLVSNTLYTGSSIYETQKNLVERLYAAGVKEEMISLTVKSIVKNSDTAYTVITYETAKIISADGTEKVKEYEWKYTLKTQDGKLKLTNIAKK